MKTLHLTNAYHPTSDGIRHFYDALISLASRSGWQLRLVVPSDSTGVRDVDDYARVYHVEAPRSLLFDSRYRLMLPTRSLSPDGPVERILRDEQPDLVDVCNKHLLCHLAGVLRKGWAPGIRRSVLVG